jgi:membrane protease YdiL (CAAX protease family)
LTKIDSKDAMSIILLSSILLFFVFQATAFLTKSFELTLSSLIVCVTVVGTTLLIEQLVFKRSILQALRKLGFGYSTQPAIGLAILISLLMLAFYPVFAWSVGAPVALADDWLWKLIGVIAMGGIAEETLFRGFVFGHFRETQSFREAIFLSMVVFAAVHLLLFTYLPATVALISTSIAIASSLPLGYLFEQGNNTIWAPVILHSAARTFGVVVAISEPFLMTATVAWLIVVLTVFLFATAIILAKGSLNSSLFTND